MRLKDLVLLLFISCIATAKSMMLSGVSQALPLYDVLILDQWGVLHDGKLPYPGTIACVEAIKQQNKVIILLSNSSKRVSASYKGLSKVGFKEQWFDRIVTSGEIGWNRIQARYYSYMSKKKPLLKVCVFGNSDEDESYLSSCGCVITEPEDADFVLARGSFCFLTEKAQFRYKKAEELFANLNDYLDRCAQAQLPMLVTNPDFHRPGSNSPMPGQIGAMYTQKHNLQVDYIGKPFRDVYEECWDKAMEVTGCPREALRFCAVGDSLEHDIAGARAVDMDSIWVSNGVHCAELDREEGSSVPAATGDIEAILKKFGVRPTSIVSSFNF